MNGGISPRSRAAGGRVLLVWAAAAAAAAIAVHVGGYSGSRVLVGSALVALGLLLEIELPQGGSAPLGCALVIALATALPPAEYATVAAVGLLLGAPGIVHRRGVEATPLYLVVLGAAAAAAGVGAHAVRSLDLAAASDLDQAHQLLQVLAGGVAYLAIARWGERRIAHGGGHGSVPLGWLVYVALLCGGALLALTYHEGVWTAAVAAVPLLLTRFSFQRYALARRAYDQTIQALSIVPELAGHAPLGHGERTGAYAAALAAELHLDAGATLRVVTASRLHHIGHLSLPELEGEGLAAPNFAEVSWLGAGILRETSFLSEVAELLEAGALADLGQPPEPHLALETAILRVASDFDELVDTDPGRAGGALALLTSRHADGEGRTAVTALWRVHAASPDVTADAIRRSEPLTAAAATASSDYRISI